MTVPKSTTSQHWATRRKAQEEQRVSYFKGFQGPSNLGTSSQYSRLHRESERTSLGLISLKPPFHKIWGLGTPNSWGGGTLATSSFSWASPDAPAVHSYLLQRAACCPCCGGRCELREGWVPAFQDVGSVNIPAIRKHESGLLRTVHLSPWPRCPVSTLDLDRPESEVSA